MYIFIYIHIGMYWDECSIEYTIYFIISDFIQKKKKIDANSFCITFFFFSFTSSETLLTSSSKKWAGTCFPCFFFFFSSTLLFSKKTFCFFFYDDHGNCLPSGSVTRRARAEVVIIFPLSASTPMRVGIDSTENPLARKSAPSLSSKGNANHGIFS